MGQCPAARAVEGRAAEEGTTPMKRFTAAISLTLLAVAASMAADTAKANRIPPQIPPDPIPVPPQAPKVRVSDAFIYRGIADDKEPYVLRWHGDGSYTLYYSMSHALIRADKP